MGKHFGILILIVVALLGLEWFGAIDIPYLDLPELKAGKNEVIYKTAEALENKG
ncbi:MAG: hypothetical protein ABFS43_15680 [Thermodesulfobacteriota bacterium]